MSALAFDEIVCALRAQGVPMEKAMQAARREQGAESRPEIPTVDEAPYEPVGKRPRESDARIIDPIEYQLDEKAIEHRCDQLAQKAGGRVIRFSHPGKTRQTEGIADRLYCFPAHRRAVWFEVKTPRGEQRPGQVLFEEIVTASGQEYACGGIGDLRAFLIREGFATAEAL